MAKNNKRKNSDKSQQKEPNETPTQLDPVRYSDEPPLKRVSLKH